MYALARFLQISAAVLVLSSVVIGVVDLMLGHNWQALVMLLCVFANACSFIQMTNLLRDRVEYY